MILNNLLQQYRIPIPFALYLICILAMASLPVNSHAQKFLQVEKEGVKAKWRFKSGDPISLKIRQSDQWINTYLYELDLHTGVILLDGLTTHLDSITHIKKPKSIVPKALGVSMLNAGLSSLGTSLLATLFYKPDNSKPFIIGASGVSLLGLGFIKLSTIHKTYETQAKFRLRIIDTTFYLPEVRP